MASGLEFNIFVNVQKMCPREKRKVVITAVYVRNKLCKWTNSYTYPTLPTIFVPALISNCFHSIFILVYYSASSTIK